MTMSNSPPQVPTPSDRRAAAKAAYDAYAEAAYDAYEYEAAAETKATYDAGEYEWGHLHLLR